MTGPNRATDTSARRGRLLRALAITAGVAVLAGIASLFVLGNPFPPRTVAMTTGPEGGDYARLGERYREVLAREGVHLRLLPSAGSLENLARLRDPRSGASVAFLAGGFATEKDSAALVSLGALFYEPLWIFCRGLPAGGQPKDLRGRRVSIGPEGSGTRALALELLRREGLESGVAAMAALTPREAEAALGRGEIDCAFMLASYDDSPTVQHLLADEKVGLLGFPHADAHVALNPSLRKVTLPMGVGNLAANRPPSDVTMVALTTSLVVRDDLHTALQFLLLEAAQEIHSRAGIFRRAGQFPAAEEADLPISAAARSFFKAGPSFIQRHLPFWLWALASRLLLVVVPLAAVAYPLARLLPALYAWVMQQRLVKLYGELKLLERELEARPPGARLDDVAAELERFERRVDQARLPNAYAGALYTLRFHIDLVRARLRRG
jgi:TRAP-type uncharacterized transport system substrate-binding protein